MSVVTTEFAWACGLFEGEGSIVSCVRGPRPARRGQVVHLYSTDRDVVERFAAAVGVGKVMGPYVRPTPTGGAVRKPVWWWGVRDLVELLPLLDRMEPLLGERRREQARALRESVAYRLEQAC